MIGLLVSMFSHETKIPKIPWAPQFSDGPDVVLCIEPNALVPYPTARVMEALDMWRSWGAKFHSITARECDYDQGPYVGEAWIAVTLNVECNDIGCKVGNTTTWLDPVTRNILAAQTVIFADPHVYDSGAISHEVGHILGLKHPCELDGGFGDLPEGYHYCKGDEAKGNVMHPSDVSTDPYIVDGVARALRK